jgi:hypothetical protein
MKLPQPQVIEEHGRPAYAVLRWSEWERVAEELEDRARGAIADEVCRDLEAGREVLLPVEVALRIADGTSPVRAVREWRGLDADELAGRAGLATADLSAIEAGRKEATGGALEALAAALEVPRALLEP